MNTSKIRTILLRFIATLVMLSVIITNMLVFADKDSGDSSALDVSPVQSSKNTSDSYFSYFTKHESSNRITEGIVCNANSVAISNAVFDEFEGIKSLRLEKDGQFAEWSFEIKNDGCYAICLNYYNIVNKNSNVSTSVKIDGKVPFYELEAVELPRVWVDERNDSGDFYTDSLGNDKLPEQSELIKWENLWLHDTQGMYDEPYEIYFTAGKHSIRVCYIDGAFGLGGFTLGQKSNAITYDEYVKNHSSESSAVGMEPIIIEAEKTAYKTSSNLYPQSDRTNAATQPNNPAYTSLNFIGGANWCYEGQKLAYDFDVPESGWYTISIKARQNINQGMNSYREITIDGEVPFDKVSNVSFPYNLKWQVYTLGDSGEYSFYLEKGKHELGLTCIPSEMSSALCKLNQAVLDLNAIYREIIMVTGTSPDVYRDYNLDIVISDLRERFKELSGRLNLISDEIADVTGTHDSQASVLNETAIMLDNMRKVPYTIPLRLSNYKSNVESLGSLLYSLSQQPLSVDYIEFTPVGQKPGNGKISFWKGLTFSISAFLTSFTQDYNTVSNSNGTTGKSLKVWVSSGRDQVKIINDLINDYFVPQSGVGVNLALVDTGTTLIQATLAGKGPDVALMIAQDTPVNLAARGALVDLSKYDLSDIESEIGQEAFIPFRYEGGLYGLPETEQFYMMFYRSDIFEELNLSIPNTWQDFYEVLNVLESNNLRVGIPEINDANKGLSSGIMTLEMLIYQHGGTLYSSDLKKTALDTEVAYEAFEQYTKLYTHYGLDQSYSFFNRIRNGEMAMAFEYYSAYNQLTVAAPELNGLWSFAPVPGSVDENGEINRTVIGSVTGSIVLKAAEEHGVGQEAVDFLKFWVSSKTQARYANLLESTMGILGRYTPANRVAFEQMNWSQKEANLIKSQWNSVTLVPEIPGGYYVNRSITSALRTVISNKTPARRELDLYNRDINNEITRKRKEFGLE